MLTSAVLAVVGAVLLVLAVTSTRRGAPQPAPSAAGTIAPMTSTFVAPPSSSSVSSTPDQLSTDPITAPEPTTAPEPPPTPAALLLPAAIPTRLVIPAIGVDSSLLTLGVNGDGTIQVPSLDDPDSKAGWFDHSPSPGTQGPSIVLGHIDSRQYGPAVFYNLGSLQPGDSAEITRDDGTVAVFTVDAVRSYRKDEIPTVEIYQNLDHAGLRLITCGGVFDPAEGSYENNIVVFASLSSSRPA